MENTLVNASLFNKEGNPVESVDLAHWVLIHNASKSLMVLDHNTPVPQIKSALRMASDFFKLRIHLASGWTIDRHELRVDRAVLPDGYERDASWSAVGAGTLVRKADGWYYETRRGGLTFFEAAPEGQAVWHERYSDLMAGKSMYIWIAPIRQLMDHYLKTYEMPDDQAADEKVARMDAARERAQFNQLVRKTAEKAGLPTSEVRQMLDPTSAPAGEKVVMIRLLGGGTRPLSSLEAGKSYNVHTKSGNFQRPMIYQPGNFVVDDAWANFVKAGYMIDAPALEEDNG